MQKVIESTEFTEEERLLLIEALCALRFVRGKEWNKRHQISTFAFFSG